MNFNDPINYPILKYYLKDYSHTVWTNMKANETSIVL